MQEGGTKAFRYLLVSLSGPSGQNSPNQPHLEQVAAASRSEQGELLEDRLAGAEHLRMSR